MRHVGMTKKQTLRKSRTSKQLHAHDGRFRPALLSQTIRRICLYSAGALIGQTVLGGAALAAPQGGQVVGGSGSIHQHGNTTHIHQNSNSLAIDWQSFDISRKETVNFQQPSSSSAALNRILDQKPSQIFGSITANGKVFLLNPNGVIFGKTASVNVGSLVAGTLDMSAKDFMAGRYDLAALAGKDGIVINRGLIKAATGGSVTLVGGAVVNEGVIVADYGQVNLAAGRKATLDFDGDGLIRFEVSEDVIENAAGLQDAVLNSGTIQAQGGQVLLTASAARDVFTNVVNNTGVIRAGRIDNQGGVVRLVGTGGNTIHSGSIDASGQDAVSTGGTVHVLGDNSGLFGDASIDVSGATGGGTVLVGGDFQGKNPDIRNAARTYISGNATINADATESGDGGKVIVWADDVTRYYGNITARGGSNAGDGGFVEVSGKVHLVFRGGVDTTAANGKMGRLLLDPTDLIISDTPTGTEDGLIDSFGTVPFGAGGVTATIGAGTLEALTTTNISLQATNSITIEKLTTNKGGTPDELTLSTNGTVEFLTGAGGFTMNTGDTIRIAGTGSLRIDAIGSTSGGTGSGSVQVGGVVTNGAGADVTVSGTDVTVGSITTAGAGSSVTLSGTTSVTVDGAITTADVTASGTASGGIAITATTGSITLNNNLTTGNATVADAAGVTTATSGNIDLTAVTGISGAGTVTTGNASVDATTDDAADTATSGTITLNVTGAGDVGLSTADALTTGSATVTTETSANEVATVGDIVVTSADRVNNGTPGTALDVSFGTASGSSSNTVGALSITTDGGAGALGEILVTSGEALNLGVLNAGTGDIGVSSASTINEAVNDATDNIVTTGAVTLAGATGIGNISTLDMGGVTDLTLNTGQSFNVSTSGVITDLAVTVDPGTTADTYALVDNDTGAANLTFSLTDAVTDLTVTDVSVASGSLNFDVTGASGNINLASVNTGAAGNLAVTATTGNIIDSGVTTVGGTASFTTSAANADINLAQLAVTGAIDVNTNGATGNATLVNATAVDLAASSVGGNLDVTASTGNIVDSGTATVGGTASFTTSAANASINLAQLAATGAIDVNTNGATGNAAVVNATAVDLATSNVGGNLDITATTGSITGSGALTVGGNSTFTAPDAASITLANAGNAFTGSVQFLSAGTLANVTVVNTTALDLQALTLTGNLDATGAGLTQSGALTIGGTTTLAAGAGNDITLATAGNDFTGGVGITSGNNVTLVDSNDIDLSASNVSGDLDVTAAAGNITSSGALTVGGNSTFTVPDASSIALTDAGNAFTGSVQFLASTGTLANVTVVNTAALDLQALTLTGNLDATGVGLTQSGALTIGGTTTLAAGAGNDITLATAGNDFTGGVGITSGNNVTLADSNAIDLAASAVSGNLSVSSAGAITDSGALTVGGTTT
ncbi:MAG TPA: filamentous hemagglutinin N-terminal domain-containing protein, partial [Gammaproteobacteria bacterium]|nr:filamentous hemagglutinin N-terminal domain-containing protein [Gammaproteobacteria bacterium]